jgi:2,7-dihydroxy-5-methyl-1-naphthoate 7-O-methyltransferase
LHTVRTGEPAFPRQFGRAFWDDLSADSGRAASFDALMGARLVADAPAVAVAYPWGTLGHVVDVGGGNASLPIAILRAHGDLRGTVGRPGGPRRTSHRLSRPGPPGRRQVGSFFDALPAGAGGYVLSGVLHDWDDEDAVRILQRCADAASETGKVLVVNHHIGDAQGGTPDTEGDLRMLSYFRGRERTLDQLGELTKSAGLQVSLVMPARSRSIIELRPSH